MVCRHVPVAALLGIVCNNAEVVSRLTGVAQDEGVTVSIRALPQWYF